MQTDKNKKMEGAFKADNLNTPPRYLSRFSGLVSIIAGMVVLMIFAGEALAQNKASNSVKGLRVLLTNDDSIQGRKAMGHDGLGLYQLRKALCAAGADVIVIGPWGRQSGKGGCDYNGWKTDHPRGGSARGLQKRLCELSKRRQGFRSVRR